MANNAQQNNITNDKVLLVSVKKKDGTIIKVPYNEFRRNYPIAAKKSSDSEDTVKQSADVDVKDADVVINQDSAPAALGVNIDPAHLENITSNIPESKSVPISPEPIFSSSQNALKQVVETSHELATTTPNKDFFVDEAAATVAMAGQYDWDAEDHASPLETDLQDHESAAAIASALPQTRDEILDTVFAGLNFTIDQSLHSRLKSLVQSRVKEIRNNDQVSEYAMRPADKGGLGLDNTKSEQLLEAILKALHMENTLTKNTAGPTDAAPLPKIQGARPSSTTAAAGSSTPAAKVPLANTEIVTPKPRSIDVPELPKPQQLVSSPATPLSTPPKMGKTTLSDVKVPSHATFKEDLAMQENNAQFGGPTHTETQVPHQNGQNDFSAIHSVGPVDEMKMFSLADLHRLGRNPKEMQNAVVQKFNILKEDSFMLYLDAVRAWFASPLYKTYQQLIQSSVNTGSPLENVIAQQAPKGFELSDFMSVVEINKHLI